MAITNDTNTSSGHSTESTDIVEVFTEKPDQPSIPQVSDDHISFILVPLGIIAILILLTAVVFFIIRKRKTDRLRLQFVPMYNAEHEESGNEWESQLLEEEMVKHGSIVKPNARTEARLLFERAGPI